jgi:hypothetical protein
VILELLETQHVAKNRAHVSASGLALPDEVLREDGARLAELSPQVLEALGALLGESAEAVPLQATAYF